MNATTTNIEGEKLYTAADLEKVRRETVKKCVAAFNKHFVGYVNTHGYTDHSAIQEDLARIERGEV